MKVYVVFTSDSYQGIKEKISERDCVITDQNLSFPCSIIDCSRITIDNKKFINEVNQVVGSIFNPEYVRPYINNFYESSIIPLIRFYVGIETALDRFDDRISEFIFEAGSENNFFSTYYMAEGESQGCWFYDRAAILSPYLIAFLKKRGIAYKIINNRSKFKQSINRLIRIYGFFIAKLIHSLIDYLQYSYYSVKTQNIGVASTSSNRIKYDCLIVSRSPAQTNFFKSYFHSTQKRVALLLGEITVAFGSNIKIVDRLIQNKKIDVFPLVKCFDVFFLIFFYLKSFQYMLSNFFRPRWFNVGDYKINLRDAIMEIVVMTPELRLYEHQLKRTLKKVANANSPIMYTSEQKSPHAFIDSEIARSFGFKCLQFMSCDQAVNIIPLPVTGDAFLVDTPNTLDKFKRTFQSDNFYYVGTLKALNVRNIEKSNKSNICYFTCPGTLEINRKIIKSLHEIGLSQKWNLMVKLHPRDTVSNYKIISSVEYIQHHDMEQSELLSQVDIAVSGNSGIIIDLLFADIPYVLFQYRPEDRNLRPVYADDRYENVCFEYTELEHRIKDLNAIRDSFCQFKQRFLRQNKIIGNVQEIDKRIDLLAKTLNGH